MPSVTFCYGSIRFTRPRLNFENFQNLESDPADPTDTIRTVTDSADAIRTFTNNTGQIRMGHPQMRYGPLRIKPDIYERAIRSINNIFPHLEVTEGNGR